MIVCITYIHIHTYIYIYKQCLSIYIYGGFLKQGYPQIINFNGIVHYKPSILGYSHFKKPPHIPEPFKIFTFPRLFGIVTSSVRLSLNEKSSEKLMVTYLSTYLYLYVLVCVRVYIYIYIHMNMSQTCNYVTSYNDHSTIYSDNNVVEIIGVNTSEYQRVAWQLF